MTGSGDSSSTDQLEFTSLQLDVQLLQKNREQDRVEFEEFREYVQANFQSVQKSLGDLQGSLSNFISGFPKPREAPHNPLDMPQASAVANTLQGPAQRFQDPLKSPDTVGSATLVDKHTGKELNLDGSNKHPYRHPHFADKQLPQDAKSQPAAAQNQQVVHLEQEQREGLTTSLDRRVGTPQRDMGQDNRRQLTLVKPAKYNIPEFDGVGTDSWIQTIEMYFEAARTPMEQKTEIVVTYLKGPAIEW